MANRIPDMHMSGAQLLIKAISMPLIYTTVNLAARGGTFLTGLIRQKYGGLTRLTRFSLYPEHPVYPV